ncbi:glycosyltransferase [bacterium]|nr:glycosyltransferase [bacterium]
MNIALFADTFYPKSDGMSTSTQNLARTLAAQGHQVLVVAPKPKSFAQMDFTLPGVQILWLESIPAGFYPQLRLASWSPRLHAALNKFAPELVHVMSPMPVSLTGMSYAKLHRLPIVATFHTYFMDPTYLQVIKIDRASQLVEELGWDLARSFHARAQVTIAPSQFVADDLRARAFAEPIVTIPNGVTLECPRVSPDKIAALRERYHLGDAPVVVSVGRVSAEKNLDALVRVWQQVVARQPRAQLLIVGGGPALAHVKKLVADLGLTDKIMFTGDINHQRVIADGYYHVGQFFVTTSCSETQGMTSLEAQQCGLPVVAFAQKGLPFVVGEGGILQGDTDETKLAATIADLLSHPNKVDRLRAKIPANLRRFDLNETTRQTVAAYAQAADILRARS